MDTKEHVERLLKDYHQIKRNLENLKLEMECFSVIEALNFAAPAGERVQNNSVTDKSSRIALIYRDVAEDQNDDILRGLVEQFYTQKIELDMLEHRINLLEPKLSGVIRGMFIEGLSWPVLGKKYSVSYATIGRYRNRGIAELCRLYDARKAIS